jgi:hypothetical protein
MWLLLHREQTEGISFIEQVVVVGSEKKFVGALSRLPVNSRMVQIWL